MVNQSLEFLNKVRNSKITSYKVNGDVTFTAFDNGITVYVNFGANDVNTPIGIVKPYGFLYEQEG